MDRLKYDFELKFDPGSAGKFSGYGSIFGNVDSYGDVIKDGAFRDTLRDWEGKGKLPPMLLQHGGGFFGGAASDGIPVGKWTSMEENSKGLKVEGFIDPIDTDEGKKIYAGLKNGGLDGLSIGYRAKKFTMGTKPTDPRRTLESVDLMELSIVTFPANDKSRIGSVKAADIKTIREFEDFLRDAAGFSRKAAAAIATGGFKAFDAQRDADDGQGLGVSLDRLLATIKG